MRAYTAATTTTTAEIQIRANNKRQIVNKLFVLNCVKQLFISRTKWNERIWNVKCAVYGVELTSKYFLCSLENRLVYISNEPSKVVAHHNHIGVVWFDLIWCRFDGIRLFWSLFAYITICALYSFDALFSLLLPLPKCLPESRRSAHTSGSISRLHKSIQTIKN